MKRFFLTLAIALFGYCSYAQATHLDNETFTYNSNTVYHYGLGWYNDPDATAYGPMAYLSSFGGIKFFTGGGFKAVFDINGNLGIGTNIPKGKLDVNGAILLTGSTNNTMPRPAVGATRITGEIAVYSNDGSIYDDGLLRLSAGAGTNASTKTFIDLSGYSTIPDMDRNIVLGTGGAERVRINSSGNVSIGTTDPQGYMLAVNGSAIAESVTVKLHTSWPDYVFKPTYNLPSLTSVRAYIDQNQHLPEMPSEQDVKKNGINLGEIVKIQTKKIEELTLYLIDQVKQIADQQKVNQSQQEQINQLKEQLALISKALTNK